MVIGIFSVYVIVVVFSVTIGGETNAAMVILDVLWVLAETDEIMGVTIVTVSVDEFIWGMEVDGVCNHGCMVLLVESLDLSV